VGDYGSPAGTGRTIMRVAVIYTGRYVPKAWLDAMEVFRKNSLMGKILREAKCLKQK
jgi:hypothetical protein